MVEAHLLTASPQCVQFVNEDDGRAMAACQLKHLVQVLLAIANVHIQYVINRNADETRLTLTCRSTRDKGLAAARRAVEQDATTDLLVEGAKEFGMLEWIDDIHSDLLF